MLPPHPRTHLTPHLPQAIHNPHASHHHRTAQLKPPGYDLGIMGVIVHVLGDAFNNVAVIIAALVIWLVRSDARFYADPALSTVIAIMILASSIPLST